MCKCGAPAHDISYVYMYHRCRWWKHEKSINCKIPFTIHFFKHLTLADVRLCWAICSNCMKTTYSESKNGQLNGEKESKQMIFCYIKACVWFHSPTRNESDFLVWLIKWNFRTTHTLTTNNCKIEIVNVNNIRLRHYSLNTHCTVHWFSWNHFWLQMEQGIVS